MADRPIIFSAPMVRALLEGRKSQTRRVLTPQPAEWTARIIDITKPIFDEDEGGWGQWETEWSDDTFEGRGEPMREIWRPLKGLRYAPGDRLYVREAFSYERLDVDRNGFMPPWYWADGNPTSGDFTRPKPSIHMPRWASRLTLVVTGVRVERLQDISETDARAEAITMILEDSPMCAWFSGLRTTCDFSDGDMHGWRYNDAAGAYGDLWNSLHGPEAWDANPWVAVYEFRPSRGNIDQMEAAHA